MSKLGFPCKILFELRKMLVAAIQLISIHILIPEVKEGGGRTIKRENDPDASVMPK